MAVSPRLCQECGHEEKFYELAVANPAGVEWYCSLKLEMAVHLVKQILTDAMQSPSVPGLADIKARMKAELERKLGETVDVDELPDLLHMGCADDFYASFEWSDGSILHVHICFWMVGAPQPSLSASCLPASNLALFHHKSTVVTLGISEKKSQFYFNVLYSSSLVQKVPLLS